MNRLKTDLSESKKDVIIIEEYLNVSQKKDMRKKNVEVKSGLNRHGSSKDLFGSLSASKNVIARRQPSKVFKGKLFSKQ